jgi:hypothetical protein
MSIPVHLVGSVSDGVEGARRRVAVASKYVPKFGIASDAESPGAGIPTWPSSSYASTRPQQPGPGNQPDLHPL